eukprot:scaffold85892_cov48-Phaeocystis_antarctica.AAC.1
MAAGMLAHAAAVQLEAAEDEASSTSAAPWSAAPCLCEMTAWLGEHAFGFVTTRVDPVLFDPPLNFAEHDTAHETEQHEPSTDGALRGCGVRAGARAAGRGARGWRQRLRDRAAYPQTAACRAGPPLARGMASYFIIHPSNKGASNKGASSCSLCSNSKFH